MNDRPKFRDCLKLYASNGGYIIFENYEGKITPVSLDIPTTASRTITTADILVDGEKNAQWDYSYTDSKNLITRVDLKYKPIIPLDNTYAAVKYCQRSGASGTTHNFLTEGSDYSAYLGNAYGQIGVERPIVFEADGIRDEATAEKLAKLIIKYRTKLLAILNLSCNYNVLDLEIFDDIRLAGLYETGYCSFLPSFLTLSTSPYSLIWKVVGIKIKPCIMGNSGGVDLKLLEIATPATALVWQNTKATGTVYQDTKATGDVYQEVKS